jgi:NADPH-dependent 2,4-dienoyl-CoA reductase/sulfur reductase-like enzyme/nitrite reductase/ring-hydroxylating ferredoxin subunit
MSEIRILGISELPRGAKTLVKVGELEILLIHHEGGIAAVQSKCPHAGGPLQDGAVCNRRLVCPWHMGTFALPGGELLEPPAMEPLKSYAVHVKEDGIFLKTDPVPNAPEPIKHAGSEPLFLIVGAGAAGSMAATTLRQGGFAGRIVAVDPATEEPIDRTQLSKDALTGKLSLAEVALASFSKLKLDRVCASVTEFSAARRQAHLSDGSIIRFDRALVATGGIPKRLDVSGAPLAYTIRHFGDVRKILHAAEGKKEVVIAGGSFIALEAASALIQKGLHVTVAAKNSLPFEKQFGEQAAKALKKLHESNGTNFRLGIEILQITGEGVEIRDGGSNALLPADLVILGVGVEPALNFEHDFPIAEDGGVLVDASLRAAEDVWIAGDIASVNNTRIEHWRVAQQHGRTAALAMLGQNVRHEGVPFFWTYHFGKRLDYLGAATSWDEIVVDGDLDGMKFLAFYLKHNDKGPLVEAILSCERESETAMLAERMRTKPTLDQARAAIAVCSR